MLLSDVGKMLNVACKGDCEFEGFAIDSRAVKKGNMFVCLPGARVDGHDFASKAAENGAACFLCGGCESFAGGFDAARLLSGGERAA